MFKNKKPCTISQYESENTFKQSNDNDLLTDKLKLKSYVASLAEGERAILNELVGYLKWTTTIFPCQNTIARATGYTRKHVNRTIAKFARDGLLRIERVDAGARYYHLASVFSKRLYQFMLVGLLPTLMGAWMLMGTPAPQVKAPQRFPFTEKVTTYITNIPLREPETYKRTIEDQEYPFWDGLKDLELEKDVQLLGQLCGDDDYLCPNCVHENEVSEKVALFLLEVGSEATLPHGPEAVKQETVSMSKKFDKPKNQEFVMAYAPNEPYQNLHEEVDWLMAKALDEAKKKACGPTCLENLKDCGPARNNPYRLALDEMQRWWKDRTYVRRAWQQIAFAEFDKQYPCKQAQNRKDSDD